MDFFSILTLSIVTILSTVVQLLSTRHLPSVPEVTPMKAQLLPLFPRVSVPNRLTDSPELIANLDQKQVDPERDRTLMTSDSLRLFMESSALLLGFLWLIILLG